MQHAENTPQFRFANEISRATAFINDTGMVKNRVFTKGRAEGDDEHSSCIFEVSRGRGERESEQGDFTLQILLGNLRGLVVKKQSQLTC